MLIKLGIAIGALLLLKILVSTIKNIDEYFMKVFDGD